MNVVVLQVFVSLMLVAASVLLFLYSHQQRDHEHADRLSLLPLEGAEHSHHNCNSEGNAPCKRSE